MMSDTELRAWKRRSNVKLALWCAVIFVACILMAFPIEVARLVAEALP